MSSGEKILSSIKEDSQRTVAEIQEESRANCDRILSKAQERVLEIKNNTEKKKAEQTEKLSKSGRSRIELEKRNMLLRTRRDEINRAVENVLSYMESLKDEEYFDLICRLAATLKGKKGVVFLCEKDIRRAPKDLEQRLRAAGLDADLSKNPDPTIRSGFILKNGDIEDNMSFSSVISERREAVEDLINQELFKD